MRRLLLSCLFLLNLFIVIDGGDTLRISSSALMAQHMDLEGGFYDCEDEDGVWYRSLIPCDALVVNPDSTYSICTYCHERFNTEVIMDHEYNCSERNKPNNPNGNNSTGGGGDTDGGGGGNSGSNSSGSSSTSTRLVPKETYDGIIIIVPEYCPIGLEGAYLAGFAYDDANAREYLNGLEDYGWIEDTEIASRHGLTMNDSHTGLDCKLMKKEVNGKTVYALTFAGTELTQCVYDPFLGIYSPDLKTDITQAFVFDEQYMQSLEIAQQLNSILSDYDLTFIGHSLGGGEAALAAMVTGRYAITYNPAGLSDASLSWLQSNGYSTDASKVFRYIATGDEIDACQGFFGIESQGHYISVPNVNGYFIQHSIENMIENMKQ